MDQAALPWQPFHRSWQAKQTRGLTLPTRPSSDRRDQEHSPRPTELRSGSRQGSRRHSGRRGPADKDCQLRCTLTTISSMVSTHLKNARAKPAPCPITISSATDNGNWTRECHPLERSHLGQIRRAHRSQSNDPISEQGPDMHPNRAHRHPTSRSRTRGRLTTN